MLLVVRTSAPITRGLKREEDGPGDPEPAVRTSAPNGRGFMDTKATAKIDYLKNQSWPLCYSSILLDGGMKGTAALVFEG